MSEKLKEAIAELNILCGLDATGWVERPGVSRICVEDAKALQALRVLGLLGEMPFVYNLSYNFGGEHLFWELRGNPNGTAFAYPLAEAVRIAVTSEEFEAAIATE